MKYRIVKEKKKQQVRFWPQRGYRFLGMFYWYNFTKNNMFGEADVNFDSLIEAEAFIEKKQKEDKEDGYQIVVKEY